jgi:hypothetical protein
MSTDLKRPESPATDRTLRVPAITANLLPNEVVEARHTRWAKGVVLAGLIGITVVLVAWYGVALHQTSNARGEVSSAQRRITDLGRQQNQYSGLISAQKESTAIRSQLSTLLADDLPWSNVLASVRAGAPSGLSVVGITGSLTTNAAAAATGGTATKATGGTPAGRAPTATIGLLTITGTGANKTVVAGYIDALAKVTGLANPVLTDATQDDRGVQFSVQIDITGAALGGRYFGKDTKVTK